MSAVAGLPPAPGRCVADPLAAAASRLTGDALVAAGVLSVRRDRDGGGDVVVAVLRPGVPSPRAADAVVVKSGPPALVAAGVRAQRRAHAASLGPSSPLAVPAVIAHDAAAGLVVMGRAGGTTLAALLRSADGRTARAPAVTGALALTGAALARLHECDVDGSLPVRGLAGHLADLVLPQPDRLAPTGIGSRLCAAAARTAQAVVAAADGHPRTARLVHRDVHPRQVLLDGRRTWLLDWDLAAGGDPALDLGNLVAGLRWRYPGTTAEPAVEALLAAYSAGDTSRALARVAVHEAFTYLRLACKRARLDGPAAAGSVTDLLHRARVALAGAP